MKTIQIANSPTEFKLGGKIAMEYRTQDPVAKIIPKLSRSHPVLTSSQSFDAKSIKPEPATNISPEINSKIGGWNIEIKD